MYLILGCTEAKKLMNVVRLYNNLMYHNLRKITSMCFSALVTLTNGLSESTI